MARKILSWTYPAEDPDVKDFEVYIRMAPVGMEGAGLGTRLGSVPAKERDFVVEVQEGRYVGYVVPIGKNGSRGESIEAQAIDFIETGRDSDPPPTPESPAIAQVDSSAQALVTVEPPSIESTPHLLQVIEGGTDPMQGRLVAEHGVVPRGPMSPNASRQPGRPIALDGSQGVTDVPDTRALHVRGVTDTGLGGTAVQRTVNLVPKPNHDRIAVASIIGNTPTNFANEVAGDAWEIVATDGLRMKAVGAGSAALGTGSAGGMVDNTLGAGDYYQTAKVESDEVDLGAADVLFVLEIYSELQRKSATASRWSTRTGDTMVYPSAPAFDVLGREANPLETGWWAMRQITGEGKPTQPLRHCKFQYVVGDTSPVDHADGDYKDHVAGETLRGRYLRVRVVLREPTGLHQIICPKLVISAQVLMRRSTGTATPEAALAAPPGSLFTDKTAGVVYHKATGYGNTGWQQLATHASVPPVGSVVAIGGALPLGWLECDGAAVSRTTYAALFAIIGTTYGVGDGSTTFNVPNITALVCSSGTVSYRIKH